MKRFFKIPFFTAGFCMILFFLIPAIPGYLITADQSTDANEIVPSIANQKPGFSSDFIRLKKEGSNHETHWLHKWLFGIPAAGELIAVKKIALNGDSITYTDAEDEIHVVPAKKLEAAAQGFLIHRKFYLGTDRFGRDVLSRLILGGRVSLLVGLVSVIISLIIGISIGMYAGYSGGRTDAVLNWLIAIFWSVPTLLIALGLSFVFGRGIGQVLVAVGLSTWVEVARVVRGQAMQLREKEFILAAKISGFSTFRILFRHMLPNLKGSLTVLATTNFASAILLEAGLSFLGLGISPPAPSWGIMVQEHLGNLVLDSAYLAIVPGAAIMILVMGFNFMSMGLRDAFDTRLNSF